MKTATKIASVAAVLTAAAVLTLPGLASAETCYDRAKDNQTTGAVLGAVAGAALGNSVSGHNRGTGTVLGAVIGGVVGSSIGKDSTKCGAYGYDNRYDRSYGYRDNNYRQDNSYYGGYDNSYNQYDRRSDQGYDRHYNSYDRDRHYRRDTWGNNSNW